MTWCQLLEMAAGLPAPHQLAAWPWCLRAPAAGARAPGPAAGASKAARRQQFNWRRASEPQPTCQLPVLTSLAGAQVAGEGCTLGPGAECRGGWPALPAASAMPVTTLLAARQQVGGRFGVLQRA